MHERADTVLVVDADASIGEVIGVALDNEGHKWVAAP